MKLLAIYAHPKGPSLNRSILESIETAAAANGHELRIRDLYALEFNAALSADELHLHQKDGNAPDDVREEQMHMKWADILLFIYPIWWYAQPAILKGWIDRVLTFGFAYGRSPEGIKGLLKHSKALVFQTAGAGEAKYRDIKGRVNDEDSPTFGTLKYCGIEEIQVQTFYSVFSRDKGQMDEVFTKVQASVDAL